MGAPSEAVRLVAAAGGGGGGASARARAASSARTAVRGGGAAAEAWRAAGGLGPLVRLLSETAAAKRREDQTVGLLLAALADCCLDPDSCREIGALETEETTLATLRRAIADSGPIARVKDDLAGRACRLLANLATLPENAERQHEAGAAPLLVEALGREGATAPTLHMAVRAVRQLWSARGRREEMLRAGAVAAVSRLLKEQCLLAEMVEPKGFKRINRGKKICKRRNDLFSGILKCVGAFSLHPNVSCATQILGDNSGYRCLIALTDHHESMALQCLINLCYVPEARPHLGAAGAVKTVVGLLNSNGERPSKWVIALRLLCREAVNRAKVEKYGGLTLLLSILRDSPDPGKQYHALLALHSFIFDEAALIIMAKEGFIGHISQLITKYVEQMDCEHHVSTSKAEDKNQIFIDNTDDLGSDNETVDSEYRETTVEKSSRMSIDGYDFKNTPNKKTKLDLSEKMESKTWSSIRQCSPCLSPLSDCSSANGYSPDFRESKASKFLYANSSADMFYYNNRSPESPASSTDGHSYGGSGPWSPGSPGMSYSPSSTSHCDNDSSDSEVSGRYSPVCSDTDDEDFNLKFEDDTDTNDIKYDNDRVLTTPKIENEELSIERMQWEKIRYLMEFLAHYAHIHIKDIQLFSSTSLLDGIIKYIERCRFPSSSKALKALLKIISNYSNFKHLLKYSFILHLITFIDKPKHVKCRQCKHIQKIYSKIVAELSAISESDYGIGEILRHLSKEDSKIVEKTSLSLPYVIKSNRALRKLFIESNGLDLFLKSFITSEVNLEIRVSSLAKLATTLQIRPPKPIYPEYVDSVFCEYIPDFDENDKVTFVLDDSFTVEADQQLLCCHSDVFVAMLKGLFMEGSQKRVRLQKVTKESMEYLLVLLKSGINNESTADTFPMPKNVSVALETLLLADRFLLEKVKNRLFSAIVQFKLDSMTAGQIYIWSLEEGMGTLCTESVAYTLVGQMNDDKRCRIISTIIDTIYKDQWVEDVRSSLLRFL